MREDASSVKVFGKGSGEGRVYGDGRDCEGVPTGIMNQDVGKDVQRERNEFMGKMYPHPPSKFPVDVLPSPPG